MNESLQKLLQSSQLWKARNQSGIQGQAGLATGYSKLDCELPGGGWPRNAVTEILLEHYGIGELKLLMPALVRLSKGDEQSSPGWIAWVAPPFQPYPPALSQWGLDISRVLVMSPDGNSELLWVGEQVLASKAFAAVLLWPEFIDGRGSRRLQLAAEKGRSMAIVFRPLYAATEVSAAALRIQLTPRESGTDIGILKSRGGRPVVVRDYAG